MSNAFWENARVTLEFIFSPILDLFRDSFGWVGNLNLGEGWLLTLAVKLEKKKLPREDLSAMLEDARGILAAALMTHYGVEADGKYRELAENIGKNLTKVQIMRTIELLQKYHGECVYNVGSGHVLGALAAELEGIL